MSMGRGYHLFNLGNYQLHSGQKSQWKIDCDALWCDDWAALAVMLTEILPPFAAVEGVPQGGIALADALRPYAKPGPTARTLLIVDDVLTTGTCMALHRGAREAIGAVIFARGPCPEWITPLFQLTAARP